MNQQNTGYVPPTDRTKWLVSLLMALVLFTGSWAYVSFVMPEVSFITAVSFSLAASASLMFAMSLSASSLSYYFGWPNMKAGYQKQIGVMAYWQALVYSFTLLYLYPELYVFGLWVNLLTPDIVLGVTAMVIFTAMTAINSKWLAPYFTWDTIKFVLGLGFVAYAMLVMRAVFAEWPLWEAWLTTFDGYPPGRLVLSLIAMVVLLLRISIPIHIKLTKKGTAK